MSNIRKTNRCTITGHIPSAFPYYIPEEDIPEDEFMHPEEDYDEDDTSYLICNMEQHPDCIDLKQRLREAILEQIKGGVKDFFSGTQQGVEMWATEIIMELHSQFPDISITLIGVSETETYHWNGNARYRAFDEIYTHEAVKFTYTSKGCYAGTLEERNRLLVQRADTVLAVFNGGDLTDVGEFLRMAKKSKKRIIILDN